MFCETGKGEWKIQMTALEKWENENHQQIKVFFKVMKIS